MRSRLQWLCYNYSPGLNPSMLRHSGDWGASDEAMMNKVLWKSFRKFLFFIWTIFGFLVINCGQGGGRVADSQNHTGQPPASQPRPKQRGCSWFSDYDHGGRQPPSIRSSYCPSQAYQQSWDTLSLCFHIFLISSLHNCFHLIHKVWSTCSDEKPRV